MRVPRAVAIVEILAAVVEVSACKESVAPRTTPTITAVSPASGPLPGGTSVTITGTNFTDVTSVTIGGGELVSRTVVSDAEITGTTPTATSPGAKDVVVTSSSRGSGSCRHCFSYLLGILPQRLAAGSDHACALNSSGAAYCWGRSSATARPRLAQRRSPSPEA